ncbi:hypothetical protein ILUMI_18952 [Ignelater luminosus]|uniref:Uncharacterized protein n=1 Tax=Ignelater luminosus TaxID=2038154 RepID=A0A8K0G619_IGNLU|nr:hypothetical protein ILUMI_18952 [Ignelater luminosus]
MGRDNKGANQQEYTEISSSADDVALLIRGRNDERLRMRANIALQRLNNWLERHKLELAPQKTEAVLLLGRNSIKDRRGQSDDHGDPKIPGSTLNGQGTLKNHGQSGEDRE